MNDNWESQEVAYCDEFNFSQIINVIQLIHFVSKLYIHSLMTYQNSDKSEWNFTSIVDFITQVVGQCEWLKKCPFHVHCYNYVTGCLA